MNVPYECLLVQIYGYKYFSNETRRLYVIKANNLFQINVLVSSVFILFSAFGLLMWHVDYSWLSIWRFVIQQQPFLLMLMLIKYGCVWTYKNRIYIVKIIVHAKKDGKHEWDVEKSGYCYDAALKKYTEKCKRYTLTSTHRDFDLFPFFLILRIITTAKTSEWMYFIDFYLLLRQEAVSCANFFVLNRFNVLGIIEYFYI